MLTHIKIRNFKRFEDVDIALDKTVVFIGPNNSGKSSALQALSLWEVGLRKWNAKYKGKPSPEKRPGVTINRKDLISTPVPSANLLWRNLRVRNVERIDGKPSTKNILIDIIVDGITEGRRWSCGFEFDYANEESLYCRPLRETISSLSHRMPVPDEAGKTKLAFLAPMSGLAARESKLDPGFINTLIGEGQTAQVLRNLCYQIYSSPTNNKWEEFTRQLRTLFPIELQPPKYSAETGELTLAYKEKRIQLDLSSSGRGCQQTMLLLAHLYANPDTVLLLDEPDAHLEIIRQRQIYHLLSTTAEANRSQIIAASHSEVILNEAAGKDTVVAFVGLPHSLTDRGSQLHKALKDIGWEHYYQAELRGWVLYLEGPTDLSILRQLAKIMNHPAKAYLEEPFVHYVYNQPDKAQSHFHGLKEAKPDLTGIAIFDRLDRTVEDPNLEILIWRKKEIENYVCSEDVLIAYARYDLQDDLFGRAEASHREEIMRSCIRELADYAVKYGRPSPWSDDIKVTDDFLDLLFVDYFKRLSLPLLLRKGNYHILAQFISPEKVDHEVIEKLDSILRIATTTSVRV